MENKENIKKFLEEYKDLTLRHQVDFATFPQFVPDGQGGFKITCQTMPIDMKEFNAKKEEFIQKNESPKTD